MNLSLILCSVLSIVVLNTCIQIEVRNQLAGGDMLPNREGGKLRYSVGASESGWRLYQSIQTQDASLKAGRPLTDQEQALFRDHAEHAERRNNVVSWTRGMGTFQYILAPLAAVWCVVLALTRQTRKARLITYIFFMTNTISVAIMFYRGYFND